MISSRVSCRAPKLSFRKLTHRLGVSKSFFQNFIKEIKVYPFNPKLLHTLEQKEERRLEFCLWIGTITFKTEHYTD